MRLTGTIPFCLLVSAGVASAQAPPALEFEVATVKAVNMPSPADVAAGKLHVGMTVDAQRVDLGFLSLPDLMTIAFKVKRYQIVGPDWIGAQRFDVQAKLPDGGTREQVPEMLQALLKDRFKLAIHRDSKEHSVYALVMGKGGSKLKESVPDPDAGAPEAGAANGATNAGMSRDSKGGYVMRSRGGAVKFQMAPGGVMHYEFSKMSMAGIADMLSGFLDRPVLDMTDLKGDFQFSLDVTMDDMKNAARSAGVAMPAAPGAGGADSTKPADAASDPSGSTLFRSIQQLGLKLEPRKSPIEIIVIDHVEKMPTEN